MIYYEDAPTSQLNLSLDHPYYCFYDGSHQQPMHRPVHWHYYIEIIHVFSGKGTLLLGEESIELTQGMTAFILPKDIHGFSFKTPDFNYSVFKFSPNILVDDPTTRFYFTHVWPLYDAIPSRLKVFPSTCYDLFPSSVFVEGVKHFTEKTYGYQLHIPCTLMHLFYNFSQQLAKLNILLPLSDDYILHRHNERPGYNAIEPLIPAFNYMHEHFESPITTKELADTCHMSYSYFSRCFKQLMGLSSTRYLTLLRISEAERLLLDSNCTITVIGEHVGFTDTSYFIQKFKDIKGSTPKQYLKRIQEHRYSTAN